MSNTVTIRATDFLNGIGVNTHLPYTDGGYANVSTVLADLSYLGLNHVRDWVINDKPYAGDEGQLSYVTAAKAGIKFDFNVVSGSDIPHAVSLIHTFATNYPGSVTAIEGPNEVNNWAVNYNGLSGDAGAIAFQNALYDASKADPLLNSVPVYNITSWPDLVGRADTANLHLYPANGAQPGQALQAGITGEQSLVPSHTAVITEAGYSTLVSKGGVDEMTQAKLTVNLLLDSAATGVKSTYLYQLLDAYADPNGQDNEKHFGLFDINNSPKPVATAIHNLTSILSSGADSNAPLTDPGYSLSGMPNTASALMIDKTATVHDLVIWNEVPIWDAGSGREIAVSPTNVSLHLQHASDVTVYDPLVGNTPIQVLSNVTDVNLPLADHALVVQYHDSAVNLSTTNQSDMNVNGTPGDDVLAGGNGNDTIFGFDGADLIFGGGGNDVLYGNQGNDTLYGGEGGDTLFGGKGADYVSGDNGDDVLLGNMGDDTLMGGDGNDSLWGGKGNDVLNGGNGDDWLSGDLGDDTLTGGAGRDTFYFAPGSGNDVITDFHHGEDAIDMRAYAAVGDQLSFTQQSGGVLISTQTGEHVMVLGAQLADLTNNGGWII